MIEASNKPRRGRPLNSGKFGKKTQVMRVPVDQIDEVIEFLQNGPTGLALYGNKVPAGALSPTDEFIEDTIDLNSFLVKKPKSTFLIRVSGESMINAGIFPGDLLVVDHSTEARHGKIVVAVVDGGITVKRLYQQNNEIRLLPENPVFDPIEVNETLLIWGVVKHVIHSYAE